MHAMSTGTHRRPHAASYVVPSTPHTGTYAPFAQSHGSPVSLAPDPDPVPSPDSLAVAAVDPLADPLAEPDTLASADVSPVADDVADPSAEPDAEAVAPSESPHATSNTSTRPSDRR
jgi:hypothetical protein